MKNTTTQFENTMKSILTLAMFLIVIQINPASAQCGSALNFDPDEDSFVYLGEGTEMIYDVENNFTMEFWIKPTRAVKTGMIAFNEQYTGWGGQNYAVFPGYYETDSCGVGISVGTNGVAVIEAAGNYMPASLVHYTSISSTIWTHIAVVYNNRRPYLYINGSLAETGPSVSPRAHVFPTATLGDVSTFEGYDLGPFGGTIDEFRIWSVAFDAATIANWYDKYTTPSHPYYSSLHTFWKLDEGSGDIASDVSGNGHTGIIINPPAWTTGWAPDLATLPSVSIGADETIYYGYAPSECKTKTAVAIGGTPPYTYNWELSRGLLAGETMTGSTSSSVTICLTDTAQLCVTVTDAGNCVVSDCANIFVEDVRCGNTGNKITICHSGTKMCVASNAVWVHLAHGDNIGPCTSRKGIWDEESDFEIEVFPNPANEAIHIESSGYIQSVEIYDALGKNVLSNTNIQDRSANLTIDVTMLESGIYTIKVNDDNRVSIQKLMISK